MDEDEKKEGMSLRRNIMKTGDKKGEKSEFKGNMRKAKWKKRRGRRGKPR